MEKKSMTHEEVLQLLKDGYDKPRGWAGGKDQPLWHQKVVRMWRGMWTRCYDPISSNYKNYCLSIIHDDFRIFSNYLDWIMKQPRFEEFCSTCDKVKWTIDKDKNGNIHYFPEYMELTTQSENSKRRMQSKGSPMKDPLNAKKSGSTRSYPIIGINVHDNTILLFKSAQDAELLTNKKFTASCIAKCCRGQYKNGGIHNDYKWSYLDNFQILQTSDEPM